MASRTLLVLCLAVCNALLMGDVVDAADDQPVVETPTARYLGKRIDIKPYQLPEFRGSVAAYTCIPYAEPPVGDLRFRRAVPKVIEGDFDATRGPIGCQQVKMPTVDFGVDLSEDCLYLDVFVPEPKPTSVAVMVWIHGGGFTNGAGSIPRQLPTSLAAINDVIVVTLNYRINVFGFLTTGDKEIEANLGLLDQRQVLIWVKENIAAFGGDPERVTIFGQSAGSGSVHFQVLSPMNAGLFSGAIMQSGVASPLAYTTMEQARQMAFAFGAKLNCSATDSTSELAECLRGLPAEVMMAHFMEDPMAMIETAVRPTIDGEFLPKDVKEITADGAYNRVKILIGCTLDEGTVMISPAIFMPEAGDVTVKPVYDRPTFETVVAGFALTSDPLLNSVAEFVYMPQDELAKPEPNYADAAAEFNNDMIFLCETFDFAEHFADADLSVYVYMMTHTPSASMWGSNIKWLGATHGEDIPYVFGSPFTYESEDDVTDAVFTGAFNDEEVQMSLQVMKYWANFAKSGNPNLPSPGGEPEDSIYPSWPNYTKASPTYKELSKTFTNADSHPFPKRCAFRLKLLPKLQENAAELARLKSLLEEKVSEDSEKSCEDPASCPEE